MIKVLKPGLYSNIQDQGRFGMATFGVPFSGAMDMQAFNLGNLLLNNSPNSAAIEVTYGNVKFQFLKDTFICVTGADFVMKLKDNEIEKNKVYKVSTLDVLSFEMLVKGVRGYLHVKGGIQTEEILGSRSFAKGITKLRLEKGDELPIDSYSNFEDLESFSRVKVKESSSIQLQCDVGPEFEFLSIKQKEYLFEKKTVSKDNNRVGYRLEEKMENKFPSMITSSVLPGTVQFTPSGELIVLMRDCQVTGGYPRVLQLTDDAISILSQKKIGDKIQFKLN